jgi:hypothetical protein
MPSESLPVEIYIGFSCKIVALRQQSLYEFTIKRMRLILSKWSLVIPRRKRPLKRSGTKN